MCMTFLCSYKPREIERFDLHIFTTNGIAV
jgi:hypothetical protein